MERAKKETLLMILAELKNRAETEAEAEAETEDTFHCCESDNRNRCLLMISRRMPDNCASVATGAIIRQ
jgi:hypothetical protein